MNLFSATTIRIKYIFATQFLTHTHYTCACKMNMKLNESKGESEGVEVEKEIAPSTTFETQY